ncbi:MAG TPA: hypothetical protein V6D22_15035 [Candidatus Obscuribacterales bacterium]
MNISFDDGKLEKQCNDQKVRVKVHGAERAKRLGRRLDDLRAAANLSVMKNLPGRCHELKQDRAGQLSIDLDGPHRLIFVPAHNPIPATENNELDWSKVTAIRILEIVDYHE